MEKTYHLNTYRIKQLLCVGILIALIQFLLVDVLSAQDQIVVKQGDRIRITSVDKQLNKEEFWFGSLQKNSMLVRLSSSTEEPVNEIPFGDISSIDVYKGYYKKGGFVSGAIFGGTLGLLLVLVADIQCDPEEIVTTVPFGFKQKRQCPKVKDYVRFAFGTGVLTGLIGMVTSIKKDHWTENISVTTFVRSVQFHEQTEVGAGIDYRF